MSFNLGHAPWEKDDLIVDAFPRPRDLQITILAERSLSGYSERLIRYQVEEGTGSDVQGWTSAYLLLPDPGIHAGERPAMLALHQCGRDCDLGKESVVGHCVDRPDQAYGLELVKLGFVVLVPDAINCGQRCMEQVRTPGLHPRHWNHRMCWDALNPHVFGGHYRAKRILDCRRAVDVLTQVDRVDASRVGVIGHSMGGVMATDAMVCDQRIRAGIMSAGCGNPLRSRIAPRLLLQMQGRYDCSPESLARIQDVQAHVRLSYERAGAADSHLFRVEECGHVFHDDFKIAAYRRLMQHFGCLQTGRCQDIARLVDQVVHGIDQGREDLWWSFPNHRPGSHLPQVDIAIGSGLAIHAPEGLLSEIVELVVIAMLQKTPPGEALQVSAVQDAASVTLWFRPGSGTLQRPMPHDACLREARFLTCACQGVSLAPSGEQMSLTLTRWR